MPGPSERDLLEDSQERKLPAVKLRASLSATNPIPVPSRKARRPPHSKPSAHKASDQLHPDPLRSSSKGKIPPSMPPLTHRELANMLLDDDDVCEIFVYRYLHCPHRHVAHIVNGPDCSLSKRFQIRCEELGIRPKVKTIEMFGGCKECLRQGLVATGPDTEDERPENPKPQKSQKARSDSGTEAAALTRMMANLQIPEHQQAEGEKGKKAKRLDPR